MTEQTKIVPAMALQPLSIDELNNLPDRLTDSQLACLEAMAAEPLPTLPPCDERHFAKCLRLMLAVLPKQNTDEVGGELFVAAYQRQLGHYPQAAISFLTDRATATCRWFPTIVECLEILREWRRNDDAVRRKNKAHYLARCERNARADENRKPFTGPIQRVQQVEIDKMPEAIKRLGVEIGSIVIDEDGEYRPAP